MTPERLITIALRSGIDLSAIAARQAPPERLRPSAVRQPTARGRETRPAWLPEEWQSEDLAMACAGMPDLSWRTLCFTVFQGEEDRRHLKAALLLRAADLARREHWPKKMRRADCACGRAAREHYLEDLCTLVLLEWENQERFRPQEALARWFGITREYWCTVMSRRFQPLSVQMEYWYGGAIGHLWRRLRETEETAE